MTHCIALIWALSLHIWTEDFDAAHEALEAFAECAEVHALGPYITTANGFRAVLAILQGQSKGAIAAVSDSLARLRAARYELFTTPFSIALARGLLLDRRPCEAAELIDTTIARCEAIGALFAMPELLSVKAQTCFAKGDCAACIIVLEQALAISWAQGALAWPLRTVIALASQLADQGRTDDAIRRLEAVLADMSGEEHVADLHSAGMLLVSLDMP